MGPPASGAEGATVSEPATVLVRLSSHRAADRLARLLKVEQLDWHYTWADGGCFARIPADQLKAARAIPSISLARPKGEVRRSHRL